MFVWLTAVIYTRDQNNLTLFWPHGSLYSVDTTPISYIVVKSDIEASYAQI